MARTHKETGDVLESAVRAIERAVIRSSPGLAEGTFAIEGNRVVVVGGVRHEIDVYVHASLAPGYAAIFLFECKNWRRRVGKNEVIVFAEKVRALAAQRGFFVAKSFSRDARAQAKLDPRIELLTAEELDPRAVLVPAGFHGIHIGTTNASVSFHGEWEGAEDEQRPVNVSEVDLVLDGSTVDGADYVQKLIAEARDARVNGFSSGTAAEGTYELEFAGERTFPQDTATLNGYPLRRIRVEGRTEVTISRAVVVSAFEIATRGRHIAVQVKTPIATIAAEFVQLPQ